MRERRDIVVVGGGLAGLSAAWHIERSGLAATVLESEAEPGGRARSVNEHGAIFDLGAWTFTHGSPAHGAVRSMGLEDLVVRIPATAGRFVRGGIRTGRLDRPWTLAGGVLPWSRLVEAGRLRLAAGSGTAAQGTTADQWLRTRFSEAMVDNLLAPLAGLYFLQSLETLAADALMDTIAYLAGARLMGFARGMGQWPGHLAAGLDVRCGHGVLSMVLEQDGVFVRGRDFELRAGGVILATPLPKALALLGSHLPKGLQRLVEHPPYARTVAVRMLLEERWGRGALQVLPPWGEGELCCGLAMERAKHPSRVPDGMEGVVMYGAPRACGELLERDDRDVIDLFRTELGRWMGREPVRPVHAAVERYPLAASLCDPEGVARAGELAASLRELSERLPVWLAGDGLGSSSVSGAASSGLKAAESACARLGSGRS